MKFKKVYEVTIESKTPFSFMFMVTSFETMVQSLKNFKNVSKETKITIVKKRDV